MRLAQVSIFARLFGIGVLLFGGSLGLTSAYLAWSQHKALESWTKTDAEILRREVYSESTINAKGWHVTYYGFRCRLRYRIGQRPEESLVTLGFVSNLRRDMQELVERYPAGNHVAVAYDPAAPYDVRFAGDPRLAYPAALDLAVLAARLSAFGVVILLICWAMRTFGQAPPASPALDNKPIE